MIRCEGGIGAGQYGMQGRGLAGALDEGVHPALGAGELAVEGARDGRGHDGFSINVRYA
jgi:hypothetical protein